MALQIARIHNNLYPHFTYQTSGPKRPDMAEQENKLSKR